MSNPQTPSDALAELYAAPPPDDPAQAAPYPHGLALDIVLNSAPLPELLSIYALTPSQFQDIMKHPHFRKEVTQYRKEMQQDGWAFRQKAKAQAEAYLGLVWQMVHKPDTPSTVKADLIKQTVRWAGLEQPPTTVSQDAAQAITAETLRALKDKPDMDLEVMVVQILAKKSGKPVDELLPIEVEATRIQDQNDN